MSAADWQTHGVRVIAGDALDTNTPQTPGMSRAAAIDRASADARKLWAGTLHIDANAKTGAHHHDELESVIYAVSGRERSESEARSCVLVRSGQEPIVVNLDIASPEAASQASWIDPIHRE